MIQSNLNLPTFQLPEKLKKWLENHELREAMSAPQEMTEGKLGISLQMPLSPEIGAQIEPTSHNSADMSATLRRHFGARVRELRLSQGVSQEAFADHYGFASSYIKSLSVEVATLRLMRLKY